MYNRTLSFLKIDPSLLSEFNNAIAKRQVLKAKGLNARPGPEETSTSQEKVAMRFVNVGALPRKTLNRNLFGAFNYGLSGASALKTPVLERKCKPNANACDLGTPRFGKRRLLERRSKGSLNFPWWTFRPRKKIRSPPPSPQHPPSPVVHHPASPPRKPYPPLYIQIGPHPFRLRLLLPFPAPETEKK